MSAAAARAVLVVEDDSTTAELERRALARAKGSASNIAVSAAEAGTGWPAAATPRSCSTTGSAGWRCLEPGADGA